MYVKPTASKISLPFFYFHNLNIFDYFLIRLKNNCLKQTSFNYIRMILQHPCSCCAEVSTYRHSASHHSPPRDPPILNHQPLCRNDPDPYLEQDILGNVILTFMEICGICLASVQRPQRLRRSFKAEIDVSFLVHCTPLNQSYNEL